MSYSLSLSRGKLQNLSTYFSSNKTLKINVFKQLDFLSFILEMQRYLHCKLHKIHSYVLAVIDWFLHKEFTTTEKYLHLFLENTTSCKLPVSKTWIAKACPLLIHHRDKTQHYAGIGAQSLCVYSLGSHILISNYYFVLWNMSFSCWFLGTSHCQVPVCESGRICCFKQHFACFELETININNLANLLKMFTDGSGSFYKSKLRSFQRHVIHLQCPIWKCLHWKGADDPKEEFRGGASQSLHLLVRRCTNTLCTVILHIELSSQEWSE